MADPAWTDAVRDDLHKDQGYPLGLGGLGLALEKLFHPQNGKYLILTTDETARSKLTVWRPTSGKIGLDTDVNGWCYATVTDENPGAGEALLEVYADDARSVLVAQGSAANGAALTLAPETGYTLAATLVLGTITASFSFAFQLIDPPMKRLRLLFDDTSADDGQLFEAGKACVDGMRADFAAARAKAEAFAAFVTTVKVRRLLPSISSPTAIADEGLKPSRVNKGTVLWEPAGLLVDQELAQNDNTGGSAEVKAGAGVFSGTPSYQSWTGKTTTAPTFGQRTQPALITATCKKALTGTPPEFEITRRRDDVRLNPGDGTESEVATFRLAVGQTWREPKWGIESMLIDYAPTATNEGGGTAISTTTTDWSVVGLKSTLSDGGKFWGIYYLGVFEFYLSEAGRDARDADELVAQKTFATINAAFTTETSDNGLSITGESGGTLTSGHKFNVDFNAPQATSPASYFILDVNETTRASRWVERLRDGGVGGASWQPNTGGSPNLQDGWIDAGLPLVNAAFQGDKV